MSAKPQARDFWSRRRAAVEAEAKADAAVAARVRERAEERRLAGLSDEALLAEHGLPEPEVLETVEEVQAFLKAALPARLRNRALRRLWRLNPVLANLDGLVDHGDDYSDSGQAGVAVCTAYELGKGLLGRVPEAKAAVVDVPTEHEAEDVAFEGAPEVSKPERHDVERAEDTREPLPAPVRRMRFHFEAET